MLYLHLSPIFAARGIKRPYSFLVKAGFTHHTATNVLKSSTCAIRLDHIEDLCRVLVCEPNDLFAWVPDKNVLYPAQNPLEKFRPSDPDVTFNNTLVTMHFSELKKVTKDFLNFGKETDME